MKCKVVCCLMLLVLSSVVLSESEFTIGDSQLFLHHFKATGQFSPRETASATVRTGVPSTWSIRGERALVQGDRYQLSGFEMEVHHPERGSLRLLSPHCDFDRLAYEIKSNAAVLLNADGLQVSGLGYDVFRQQDKVMLIIRSTVQIHFHKEKIKKLGSGRL